MYYSGMRLCAGHENSVVIRELSLYPQSLLAKLTVVQIRMYSAPWFKNETCIQRIGLGTHS